MFIFLAAALAAAEPPVVVSSLGTAQLAESCRGQDADAAATFCTGYVIGVFDALSLSHQICPSPARASTGEVAAAARKYLRTHRKKWSSAPSFVLRDALRAAFPCKGKAAGSAQNGRSP